MSNTRDIDVMKSIQKELKEIRTILAGVTDEQSTTREIINLIHIKVSDLSCKVDEESSTINLVKTSNKKIKSVSKSLSKRSNRSNIMLYFKNKYVEHPEVFDEIIPADERDTVLAKFEKEIKSKKKSDVERYKSGIIYNEFIKNNKVNTAFVKELQDRDEMATKTEIEN